MAWFLKDTKESDKIALMILYTGIALVVGASGGWAWLALRHLEAQVYVQAVDACKTVVSLGSGLVTSAAIVLRFQSKPNGNGQPQELPKAN